MNYTALLVTSRSRFHSEYEMYSWLYANGLFETIIYLFPHFEIYYVDECPNPRFRSRLNISDWILL